MPRSVISDMMESSPRMVTATDHLSSLDSFPKAIFAGGCCNNSKIAATMASIRTRKNKTTSQKAKGASWLGRGPSRFLPDLADGRIQTIGLKPKKSRQDPTIHLAEAHAKINEESIRKKNRNAFLANESGATGHRSVHNFRNQQLEERSTVMSKGEESMKPKRPMSRAIAIKKSNRLLFDEVSEPNCSTEQMYDWATWKLYHRITDYRRRYPIRYTDRPVSVAAETRSRDDDMKSLSCERIESGYEEEHFFDGEVFDLEL